MDLLTRLRQMADTMPQMFCGVVLEAIKEIERLRRKQGEGSYLH